jgi:hypothetical protein
VISYLHSGAAGDLIYALPAMRAHCLQQHSEPKFDLILGTKAQVHHPFRGTAASNITPLLLAQPYINEVRVQLDYTTWDYNLDGFRKAACNGRFHQATKTITAYVCDILKVDPACSNEPWITVNDPIKLDSKPVVINRTARYNNPYFPWRRVMQFYGPRAVFVGTEQEHMKFVFQFGAVDRRVTLNALELARVVAGSELFVGNQSLAYAIAEGLKIKTIQETCRYLPNCIWDRTNASHSLTGNPKIEPL